MKRLWILAALACGAPQDGLRAPHPVTLSPTTTAPIPARITNQDALVERACAAYLELVVQHDPEDATELGRHEHDDTLTDRSDAAAEAYHKALSDLLTNTEAAVQGASLSKHAQVDLEVLRGLIHYALLHYRALDPLHRMPSVYIDGPLGALFAMTAREYAAPAVRAHAAVARLGALDAALEIARTNLLQGIHGDRPPPRPWVLSGIKRAKNAQAFLMDQREFLRRSLPQAQADAAIAQAAQAIATFARFLERDVLPLARGDFSVGAKVFGELVNARYGLVRDVDAPVSEARASFTTLSAQMDALAKELDPRARSYVEVLRGVKSKHPLATELRATYTGEVARARAFLVSKDVVTFPEGDRVEVIDTPSFLRATTGAAYDRPPPFGNESGGYFFVTPIDPKTPLRAQEEVLREHDFGDIVNTSVHEAYPGHHLQLSIARANPSLIRRMVSTPILSEGWALYSEELMYELGYYTKEERLMQLEWARVRAARVVIDVELHTGALTPERAIDYLVNEVHLERALASSEVDRYVMTPTQPMAYWIGRQAILAMRERAKKAPGFSLKAFHDELLAKGSIPPALIEREMAIP
jgi:uncharacterized protein (DUF885 family)